MEKEKRRIRRDVVLKCGGTFQYRESPRGSDEALFSADKNTNRVCTRGNGKINPVIKRENVF